MILGSPAEVMTPNVEALFTLAPGWLKCTLLKRLKKSNLICSRARSRMGNAFCSVKSTLKNRGLRSKFRGAVPNVPGALSVKAAVLKYFATMALSGRSPGSDGSPCKSARSRPTPLKERSCPDVTVNGVPLLHVQMPPACHDPNGPLKYHGDCANRGRSHNPHRVKLWRVSKSERP